MFDMKIREYNEFDQYDYHGITVLDYLFSGYQGFGYKNNYITVVLAEVGDGLPSKHCLDESVCDIIGCGTRTTYAFPDIKSVVSRLKITEDMLNQYISIMNISPGMYIGGLLSNYTEMYFTTMQWDSYDQLFQLEFPIDMYYRSTYETRYGPGTSLSSYSDQLLKRDYVDMSYNKSVSSFSASGSQLYRFTRNIRQDGLFDDFNMKCSAYIQILEINNRD